MIYHDPDGPDARGWMKNPPSLTQQLAAIAEGESKALASDFDQQVRRAKDLERFPAVKDALEAVCKDASDPDVPVLTVRTVRGPQGFRFEAILSEDGSWRTWVSRPDLADVVAHCLAAEAKHRHARVLDQGYGASAWIELLRQHLDTLNPERKPWVLCWTCGDPFDGASADDHLLVCPGCYAQADRVANVIGQLWRDLGHPQTPRVRPVVFHRSDKSRGHLAWGYWEAWQASGRASLWRARTLPRLATTVLSTVFVGDDLAPVDRIRRLDAVSLACEALDIDPYVLDKEPP